jgi:hypothetical protein
VVLHSSILKRERFIFFQKTIPLGNMSRNRRYDDQEEEEDYEEGENESEINNSEMDEKLNEAEQYKSMGNKHMASMVSYPLVFPRY